MVLSSCDLSFFNASSTSIWTSGTGRNTSKSSSSATTKVSVDSNDGVYHFYCVNDMHGSVLELDEDGYEAGIAKYFGKLKTLKDADPNHTVILSAGDMYQGSFESNINYGALITDTMNYTGFDAMTVGNHEFDWGVERLLANKERANFPMLGGNIVQYSPVQSKTPWNNGEFAKSTIIERGGNKIGIVGMIGQGQTTSITSTFVQDMDFVDPKDLSKEEALRLRNEEGCSMVILVIHDKCANSTWAADKTYFDGVFNGHSHWYEDESIAGVPFVQSGHNAGGISHIEITINNGVPACSNYEIINSRSYWASDPNIQAIIDPYLAVEEYTSKATAYAGHIDGTLTSGEGIPCIIEKAIWAKYAPLYSNLRCTMCNSQRDNLTGDVYYKDISKATPFLNRIIIASIKGSDIIYESRYNNVYSEVSNYFDPNGYYTVAIIDYILFHQNTSKQFDYFTSLNEDFDNKIIATYETYPFDLVFDYIKNDLNGQVNVADFTSSSQGFGCYSL